MALSLPFPFVQAAYASCGCGHQERRTRWSKVLLSFPPGAKPAWQRQHLAFGFFSSYPSQSYTLKENQRELPFPWLLQGYCGPKDQAGDGWGQWHVGKAGLGLFGMGPDKGNSHEMKQTGR